MNSSRNTARSRGADAFPINVPSAESPTTAPNHAVDSDRNAKASRNDNSPTHARSTLMAEAASRMPPAVCVRSSSS